MIRLYSLVTIGLMCFVAALVGCSPIVATDQPPAAGKPGSLDGAWENITVTNAKVRAIKHFNGSQYIWVIYNRKTKTSILMGGGTWSLKGNEYRETQQYCSGGIQKQLLGRELKLNVQIQGEQATFTGVLPNGGRINETLRRMR